ncbi:MBL fold metallo-hydrolase [Candidatus Nomurabacteria bacterium]|nr:MBL fold metallo-hydrolase [Candidatus Nomurabacteria bacterium]
MIITYEGAEFIKIQQGDTVVAFNPVSKDSKLKSSNFGADIALITANHHDLNGVETVTRGEKEPFVINGPGEYEVEGLFIKGYSTKTNYGGTERINTIFSTKIDNINVVFLGAMSDTDFSADVKEDLDDVDILFVPIGGEGVLDASEAYKLAVKREPKVIIPIHFGSVGSKDALKDFLKEGGSEDVKPVEKLTVKMKDIEKSEGDIIVLKSNNN